MSMSHPQMIEVIQAHANGVPIQCRATELGIKAARLFGQHSESETKGVTGPAVCLDELQQWSNHERPDFNFSYWEYRIKPTPPKPREWWIYMHGTNISSAHPVPFMSKELAEQGKCDQCTELIRLREVLPEEEGA